MSLASSLSGCDFSNSKIYCVSSSKEPLCKDAIANPATHFGFDPDNCNQITSSILQTAIEQLCTEQATCATSTTLGQDFNPAGVIATTTLGNQTIRRTLGTDITTNLTETIFGTTGTYYIESSVAVAVNSFTTAGTFFFSLAQGNTDTTFVTSITFGIGNNEVTADEQVTTQRIQGMICVTDIEGNDRNNEIRFILSSDADLVMSSDVVAHTTTIHKISSTPCT